MQGRNLSCLGSVYVGGGVGSPDFQPPGHGLPPAKKVNISPQPTQMLKALATTSTLMVTNAYLHLVNITCQSPG